MYRVEDKFILNSNNYHEMVRRIYEFGGVEIHNTRIVNSVYFDTHDLVNYRNSIEGVIPRLKIRLRWYGETLVTEKTQLNFEKKYQTDNGRFKSSRSLNPSERCTILHSGVVWNDAVGSMDPTALVSYRRRYFQMKNVRVTIDSDISYYSVNSKTWRFGREAIDSRGVLEFKYTNVFDAEIIQVPNLENVRRFSKYCNAIDAIRGYRAII